MLRKQSEGRYLADITLGRKARFRKVIRAASDAEAYVLYEALRVRLGVTHSENTIKARLSEYLLERRVHDSDKTYAQREAMLMGPLSLAFGALSPDLITRALITTYQTNRTKEIEANRHHAHKHGGRASVNMELSYLRAYVRWMHDRNYCMIDLPPFDRLKLPRRKPRAHLVDTCLKVISAMPWHWRRYYAATFLAGLRQDEIKHFTWRGVLWDTRMLHVKGKGGVERDIPLNDDSMAVFVAQNMSCLPPHRLDDLVFPSTFRQFKGKPRVNVKKALAVARERAGVSEWFSPHDLRHSFATGLHSRGIDIAVIQGLLGHADIKDTMIYTQVTRELMIQAVKTLEQKTTTNAV